MIPRAIIPIFHYGLQAAADGIVRGSACVLVRFCNSQWTHWQPLLDLYKASCRSVYTGTCWRLGSLVCLPLGNTWSPSSHCTAVHHVPVHHMNIVILCYFGLTFPPSLTMLGLRKYEICISRVSLTEINIIASY